MKQNQYQPCSLHENQLLQIVCQQCEQASLACPVCIDQYHLGHSMISLKKFISAEIPKLYTTKPNIQKINQGIQSVKSQFLSGFEQMRKSIGYQINKIQQVYDLQAQRMKKQVQVVCGKGSWNMQNITAIKRKLKQKQIIPEQEKIQASFKDITLQVNFFLTQTTQYICKTIRQLSQYWDITSGVILNSKKKAKHYFSQSLKHELIQVKNKIGKKGQTNQKNNNTIAINKSFDNKYHIAVIQPPLNPFKNQVLLKIEQSVNNCIWIGVCDVQKVKQKSFQNCYKKNQGCYWLWQSGGDDQCQFFSSLLQQSISLEQSIKVGDKISVKIEYRQQKTNIISFYKVNQEQGKPYALIYKAEVQKKQLYACVGMGDQLQKVSLVVQEVGQKA